MTEKRLIKKYPNRRLYDTTQSCYITLNDVKQFTIQGVEVQVIDAHSCQDLTKVTLLQVIYECEEVMEGLFALETLRQIIVWYQQPLTGAFRDFLEQSIYFFISQTALLKKQDASLLNQLEKSFPEDIAERNLVLWQTLHTQLSAVVKGDGTVDEQYGVNVTK